MKPVLPAFALALLAGPLGAELPPSAYRERQARAPEHLAIRVLVVTTRVTEEPRLVRTEVRADAEVERVYRSASGLRPGNRIPIRYEHLRHKEPIAGPGATPILRRGERVPAFLSKETNSAVYRPAAGGYSFRAVD